MQRKRSQAHVMQGAETFSLVNSGDPGERDESLRGCVYVYSGNKNLCEVVWAQT